MVLIAGISAPAYAQTITDHVVINEVDTNPPGDDSESMLQNGWNFTILLMMMLT